MNHRVAMTALVWLGCALAWASPAHNLFDEATRLLSSQYGGVAQASLPGLQQKYKAQLQKDCGVDPQCPSEKAVGVLRAMLVELGDKHTRFFTPEEYAEVQRRLRGGTSDKPQMGLQLRVVEGLEGVLVLEVLPETPGEEAGLRRGDLVFKVNGQALPQASDQRLNFLRDLAAEGKPMKLEVSRLGKPLEMTLEPRLISLQQNPSLHFREDGIAVLRIPSFTGYMQVGPRVHDLVRLAQQQNAKGLVIDLRNNGGGLLSECLVGAGAFVGETFRRLRQPGHYSDQGYRNGLYYNRRGNEEFGVFKVNQALWTAPVVVLVNERTASCAEYFAFDLKEVREAPIVGLHTAGVGNTATVFLRLSDGSGLQITTSQAERRDGTAYPERVTPDLIQADEWKALAEGRDAILERAIELLDRSVLR